MKSYIVDRSGLTPQLNEMPTNVEKIYPTKADAEAALANGDIADGEFVSTVDTVADTGDKFDKTYLSYSTEETLTGGTWIDGKPIYRKVIPAFRNGSWTSNWSTTQANYYYNPTDIPTYIDTLVNARAQSLRTDGWYDSMTQVENKGLTININTQTMWAIWPTTVSKADIILEYTKTGD